MLTFKVTLLDWQIYALKSNVLVFPSYAEQKQKKDGTHYHYMRFPPIMIPGLSRENASH